MVQTDSLKDIVVVCGPTASGKTALAVDIAKTLGSEIISADSIAVYQKLDIGTAKPTALERRAITHRLIDVVSPTSDFSVAEYEKLALSEIERIQGDKKTPVVCGGTGYFIDAVLFKKSYGKCPKNEKLRREFEKIFNEKGANYLYEMLRAVDPVTCEKLSENDFLRVSRALEIYYVTGKRKSDIVDEKTPRFRYVAFCIDHDRNVLYERINARVDQMMKNGLVQEVKSLLDSGVLPSAQSMQGIGYKEIVEGLLTGATENEMAETIKQNTRRYAKRQITYFKKMEHLYRLPPENPLEKAKDILINERFIY